jgi:excisionase family DNA binding protein
MTIHMAETREQHDYDKESTLTVQELAALLRLSPTTIYRLAARREIPFYRLPNGLRFMKSEINEYLVRHRVEARDDV